MIITNCVVTQQDSNVIKEYVDNNRDPLYREYKGYHTGIDIEGSYVYSLCPGVVVSVGQMPESSMLSVIVQYDNNNCFVYNNLVDVKVTEGQTVSAYHLLGQCKKYVHFEYINSTPSIWPVRVGMVTFYKHNPTTFATEGYGSLINYAASILYNAQNYDVVLY